MKKINIFLKDITENGGGERVCVNLANAFANKYQVKIFSFYKSFDKPTYKIHQNVKISYLSEYNFHHATKIKKIFLKTLYRYLLSLQIFFKFINVKNEILLANDGFFLPFFKNKNLKYLRIWHIKTPKKKKRIFSHFDAIIILSSQDLKKWHKWHKNIIYIPNFLPKMPDVITNHQQKVVLFLGRFSKEKGVLRLIDIWKKVQEEAKCREWNLVFVGDGVLKEAMQDKINKLNLNDTIIIKGFTNDVEKEYLSASIYAMSSYSEGFGMVLIESASYALPSVAFDIAGLSDIIENEKSGFLIEDGNLQEFAKKLQLLMRDENLRKTMGENAKIHTKKHFSKELVLQKWQDLFASLK